MTSEVTYLCPRERIWVDSARIGVLFAELGRVEVQAMLDRAMAELCTLHEELSLQYAARDMHGFARNLRRLGRIADHLGLCGVTQITADVTDCLARSDSTALSATWARLARGLEQARFGAWLYA